MEEKIVSIDDLEEGQEYVDCHFLPANQKMMISNVTFRHCTFQRTDFSNSEWLDCTFTNIDFSNCHFEQSDFYRDRFVNCNLLGSEFYKNVWKDSSMNNCRVDLANFSASKMTSCCVRDSSFKETYFRYVIFSKGFKTNRCHFQKSSFLDTKLDKVDFSNSDIQEIELSSELLKGVIVNQFQAMSLMSILGIIIK